nr:MAG TPA: Endodeoxyribonuclease RusA [Caudoviricetes sp.]
MYRFIIKGETPAKKNSRIVLKGGRNIPSERYRKWHTAAMIEINSQLLLLKKEEAAMPIEREIRIRMTFYHGDNRRRDSDNGASSILDLLTDCNVIKDDKWQIVRALEIQNIYDKGNPRCFIEIDGYDE